MYLGTSTSWWAVLPTTALALEAEERSMLELVRAAAVQRERESEERDDEDPEHSSGPDSDLETASSSIRL